MTDLAALWTLPELTERVVAALSEETGASPNGRVREVPDARTIRWYQTTGLVDRPEVRGRTAYYGERQLLQLLAIKRLQAQGRALGEVQGLLAGLSDEALASIVGLPKPPGQSPATAARRFWTRPPAPAAAPAARATAKPDRASSRHSTVDVIHLREDVRISIDAATWHLGPAEEAAVLEAAAPLLATLQRLGVITPETTDIAPGDATERDAVRHAKEQP